MNNRVTTLALGRCASYSILALALLLMSCGSGATSAPGNNDGNSSTLTTGSDARALPIGSELPSLPQDLAAGGSRSTSTIGEHVYLGSGPALINYSGGVVDGDNLILTSTESDMAWAMYRAEGLSNLYITAFGVMTVPGTPDTTWYGGISNFSDGVWDWLIETTLPEIDFDLTQNQNRIVSPLGNMYWVVALPAGGATLKIEKSKLIADDFGGGGWRPGEGNFLFASCGLPDSIELQWGQIDGAQYYELYRREASLDRWNLGEFELLVMTEEPFYSDTGVTIGIPYEYEVRAVNDEGPGGFSNIALGWAGNPGDPGGNDASAMGTIEAITEVSLILSGDCFGQQDRLEFVLTPDTVYFDVTGTPVDWNYLQAGMLVMVIAHFDVDGNRSAECVMEAPPDGGRPPHGDFVIGQLTVLEADYLEVTDMMGAVFGFQFGEATIWLDEQGQVVDPTSFATGDMVGVMTDPANPGGNFAAVVQKLPPPPDGNWPPLPPGDPPR